MIINTNAAFGFWPFQRFSQDTPGKMSAHFKSEGISVSLVSSVEAILARDPDIYNREIVKKLKKYPNLQPVMVINPLLADCRERLNDYARLTKINVVKIYPAYHSYALDSECMHPFMKELRVRQTALMVQARIEDDRSQFPSMRVPSVDTSDIIRLAQKYPANSIVCLCLSKSEAVNVLKSTENVFADISYMDGLNSIPDLLMQVPSEKIVFGSHTPFLYTASARLKMAEISGEEKEKIYSGNISSILDWGDIPETF